MMLRVSHLYIMCGTDNHDVRGHSTQYLEHNITMWIYLGHVNTSNR